MLNGTFPQGPDALTPGWLTQILRSSGAIKAAAVQSLRISPPAPGVPGLSCLVTLTYDTDEASAPQTLYVKFSAPDVSPDWVWMFQNEVRFYQQLSKRSGLRTPHCYYSDINAETGHHVLVMEAIDTINEGDIATGLSLESAEQAMRSIATFHASWWEKPELATLDWLDVDDSPPTASDHQEVWQQFVDAMGGQIPDSFKAIGARYGENIAMAFGLLRESPQTLVHGDYHAANLLFSRDGLVVIDWHLLFRGRGACDIGYLLSSSLQPADRRAGELAIVQRYHDILIENGVEGYSFDECFRDYRLSILRLLHVFVVVGGNGALEQDYGTPVLDALQARLDAALTDLKIAELVYEYV